MIYLNGNPQVLPSVLCRPFRLCQQQSRSDGDDGYKDGLSHAPACQSSIVRVSSRYLEPNAVAVTEQVGCRQLGGW